MWQETLRSSVMGFPLRAILGFNLFYMFECFVTLHAADQLCYLCYLRLCGEWKIVLHWITAVCRCARWARGETVAEDKEDAEKESTGRRRSRRDREQDLAKKMTATEDLSDRFESRGELRAVDNEYVILLLLLMFLVSLLRCFSAWFISSENFTFYGTF